MARRASVVELAVAFLVVNIYGGSGQPVGLEGTCEAFPGSAGCSAEPATLGGVREQPDLTDGASLLQIAVGEDKGLGHPGNNPDVALLNSDREGLSCSHGVQMWKKKTACESYRSFSHIGLGDPGSSRFASKCGKKCGGGKFSVGESGDCRCCTGKWTNGLVAWATWQCAPPPPVPCKMSRWSDWTSCSKTCGAGTRSRSRSVTTPPRFGGEPCSTTDEKEECSAPPCPVDAMDAMDANDDGISCSNRKDKQACELYSSFSHIGEGDPRSPSQASKCAKNCDGGIVSVGESGDCRCCKGEYTRGLVAWATWECAAR